MDTLVRSHPALVRELIAAVAADRAGKLGDAEVILSRATDASAADSSGVALAVLAVFKLARGAYLTDNSSAFRPGRLHGLRLPCSVRALLSLLPCRGFN